MDINKSPLIIYLETYLSEIIQILKVDQIEKIESTFGEDIIAFGPRKLKILDIIILSLNFMEGTNILKILCEENTTYLLFVH